VVADVTQHGSFFDLYVTRWLTAPMGWQGQTG
jgi:hypothetical protein